MDVRVDEPLGGPLPWRIFRRQTVERTVEADFHRGLDRVLGVIRATRWEWGIAIAALFLLQRYPVLFIRSRLGVTGGAGWQDQPSAMLVFGTVQAIVLVMCIRRVRATALMRQPMLLALVALAWLSMAWSVNPWTTLHRSLLFVGTVVVGAYVGDRFSPSDVPRVVSGAAFAAAAASFVALVAYPELATSTNGVPDVWSGVFVNRNHLAMVMSYGLLAVVFAFPKARRKLLLASGAIALLILLYFTKSRTGPVALVVALVVAVWVDYVRSSKTRFTPLGGAVVVTSTLGSTGMLVDHFWVDILQGLGRSASLSSRTEIWQVTRWFVGQRPLQGWGFEALWADPHNAEISRLATGFYPYSSHNGYYEVLAGLGWLGLAVLVSFLAVAVWRAFRYAWARSDLVSLWPLSFMVFAIVVNFSESLFISSEAILALTVASAIGVTQYAKRGP